jgi:hypothetical protein
MPLLLPLLLAPLAPPQTVAEDRCATLQSGLNSAVAKPPPKTDLSHQYHGIVIVTATQPFCIGSTVVSVFRDKDLHWVLRRTSIGLNLNVVSIERWAYSTACPAILDWLERLERLPIRFGIGPIRQAPQPQRPKRAPMLDGIEYSVRGYGWVTQPSGAPATLSLSSNDGEVATWTRGLLQATESCWKAA